VVRIDVDYLATAKFTRGIRIVFTTFDRHTPWDHIFYGPNMSKHLDGSTQITLIITLVLFVVALFEKGFTHDLLLEAAVFLVSAKLVLLSYKASVNNDSIAGQLAEVSKSLTRIEQTLEGSPASKS
jgi:hypothetical protein